MSHATACRLPLWVFGFTIAVLSGSEPTSQARPPQPTAKLQGGAAKVDVTNEGAGPVNDRLYVKALALKSDDETVVLITVDAVAIGEIGPIGNDYLGKVRGRLEAELGVKPERVLVNASHCHGIVRSDVDDLTVQAVREALASMVPVTVGAGVGQEDRIMENRRLKLKNGQTVDVRHAYSMPHDDEVAEIGPVDPQIGLLRLDREDGRALAVVYNFACHPIQGVPSGGNTADLVGFASRVIEENVGDGAIALFLQGCAGDINPVGYKAVDQPRDAEVLGNRLGLSVLRGLRAIKTKPDGRLKVVREILSLPRADFAPRIAALEAERLRLLDSLEGTSLNLKTFMPLAVKYGLAPEFPAYYSHGYLREQAMGRDGLSKLDGENRKNMAQYMRNVRTMEQLTRIQTNLALLRKHQAQGVAVGLKPIDVELAAVRIGDLALVTFPGELTVRIGLNLKKASPHPLTFVAGYTNGYIYYAPTSEQLANPGAAQEDCDTLLAPEWQAPFEAKALELLKRL